MKTGMKTRTACAVAIAIGLLVAACGDDSTNTASDTSAGGSTPTSGDLVVGVLVPLTGELGSWGEDWATNYELAVEHIKDAGVLPEGTNIKLIVEDEGASAETAVRAGRKLIEVDGVDVIVGPTSLSMVALEPLAKTHKVPVISPAAGTVRLDTIGGEWLYRTYPSDSAEGAALAEYYLEAGVENMAFLVQNEESAQGIARVLREDFEAGGGKVVADVEFDGGQPSYQAQVNQAVKNDPELLYLAAGEESARTIIREIRQAGFEGEFAVNGDLTSPGFMEEVGADLMEGVCGGHATPDESTDLFKSYAEAYKDKAGEETYVTQPNAYDSMILIALAARAAGDTSGEAINSKLRDVAGPPGTEVSSLEKAVEALEAGEEIDYVGPSGILDFDESGTSPVAFSVQCVEGGEWTNKATFQPEELSS